MRSSLTSTFVPFCGRFFIVLSVAAFASMTSSKAFVRQDAELKIGDTSEGSTGGSFEGFGIEIETLNELKEFGGRSFENKITY